MHGFNLHWSFKRKGITNLGSKIRVVHVAELAGKVSPAVSTAEHRSLAPLLTTSTNPFKSL